MHISIVIFTSPNESSITLYHIGNHIIDESMFIPNTLFFIFTLEFCFINFLKSVFEEPIISFHDCVFGRQVKRHFSVKSILHWAPGESRDRIFGVKHCHGNTSILIQICNLNALNFSTLFILDSERHFSFIRDFEVLASVLISESVSSNDNGTLPIGNYSGYIFYDDRFSENCSIQLVSNGSVGRLPHFFQAKFFHTSFIRSDGCTLNSYTIFLNSLSRF